MSQHLREAWRRLATPTSWRPVTDEVSTARADCVILTQFVGNRRTFEVYTYGVAFANRPSLEAAKEAVEEIYGPLAWRQVSVPKIEVVHYYFGPTEEFSDPTTLYTADLPRLGGRQASLAPVTIAARDVRVGDRTSRDGKTRVSKVHPDTSRRVLVQTMTSGARSPSIAQWAPDEQITVWRGTEAARRTALGGDDVIRRGLTLYLNNDDKGWDLAQKFLNHTVTADDIVHYAEPLGVWWGIESQYGGMEDYEVHGEQNFGTPLIQAMKESIEESDYYKGLDPNTPPPSWSAGPAAWRESIEENNTPRKRWFGGDVSVIFTAKRPVVNGKAWDPAEDNPINPLMGNSYLPDHQPLEIIGVRYDIGDGYRDLTCDVRSRA